MEVCGTHTTSILRSGIRDIFPEGLTLVDGPGCPVCVTPNHYLDRAIAIAREHGAILATFGDMIKVPSSYSSLAKEQAIGMDVRVVYSPIDAVEIARTGPDRQVVFLSVGFETTAPTEAAAVMRAREAGVGNFSILSGNKLTPPAVEALLLADEVKIDAFLLPGHVSTLIGVAPWRFIAERHGRPCVVAGFEPGEILMGMLSLLDMVSAGRIDVLNAYPQAANERGNARAIDIMNAVFAPCDSEWRGIGIIPASGLDIRPGYESFDAAKRFPVTPPEPREHRGCRCGELLRGLIEPADCPLYGKACTPEEPVGPCMVSSEGPCAAYYKYWSPAR